MTSRALRLAVALAFAAGCSGPTNTTIPYDAAVDVKPDVPEDVFIGTGNLRLTWTVLGMPAAAGCAAAGGVSVRFPANFVQFAQDTTVPCTRGELVIMDTAATLAAITAELLNANGEVIRTFIAEVNVRPGMTNAAAIRFEPPGRLQVRWTINGMPARTECGMVNGSQVQFFIQRSRPFAAPCNAGTVVIPNVQVGPISLESVLAFNMGDRRSWPRVNGMAEINSEQTTTTEVDFEAMRAMMMP